MTTYEGGCLCGAVRYAYDTSVASPLMAGLCSCGPCRAQANNAFMWLVLVKDETQALKVTRGQTEVRVLGTYEGKPNKMEKQCCGACGTALFQCPTGAPFTAIFAGTFDFAKSAAPEVPELFKPTKHVNVENSPVPDVFVGSEAACLLAFSDPVVECPVVPEGEPYAAEAALSAHCSCGAVELTVADPEHPAFAGICHGVGCRKISSAPALYVAGYPEARVTVASGADHLKTLDITSTLTKTYCAKCFCNMYHTPAGSNLRVVYPASFERVRGRLPAVRPALRPTFHAHLAQGVCPGAFSKTAGLMEVESVPGCC